MVQTRKYDVAKLYYYYFFYLYFFFGGGGGGVDYGDCWTFQYIRMERYTNPLEYLDLFSLV